MTLDDYYDTRDEIGEMMARFRREAIDRGINVSSKTFREKSAKIKARLITQAGLDAAEWGALERHLKIEVMAETPAERRARERKQFDDWSIRAKKLADYKKDYPNISDEDLDEIEHFEGELNRHLIWSNYIVDTVGTGRKFKEADVKAGMESVLAEIDAKRYLESPEGKAELKKLEEDGKKIISEVIEQFKKQKNESITNSGDLPGKKNNETSDSQETGIHPGGAEPIKKALAAS